MFKNFYSFDSLMKCIKPVKENSDVIEYNFFSKKKQLFFVNFQISQELIDMLANMAQQYGMQQSRTGSRASRK